MQHLDRMKDMLRLLNNELRVHTSANWDTVDAEHFYHEMESLAFRIGRDGLIVSDALQMIELLPLNPIYDEYGTILTDLIYRSSIYPFKDMWTVKPFTEFLADLKTSAFDGANILTQTNGCPFPSVNAIVTKPDEIVKVVCGIDKFSTVEIDNLLNICGLITASPGELFDERHLVESIKRTGYSAENYSDSWQFFEQVLSDSTIHQLNSL